MPAPAERKKKDLRQRKEATEDGQSFGSEQAGGQERRRKINEIAKQRTQRTKRKGERSIIMMAGRSEEGGQNPGQSGAVEARTKGVAVGRKAFFGAQLR